jgi:hypothetical protein
MVVVVVVVLNWFGMGRKKEETGEFFPQLSRRFSRPPKKKKTQNVQKYSPRRNPRCTARTRTRSA